MPNADASAKHSALTALTALSPLDGRYRSRLEPLAAFFSEAGLIRSRMRGNGLNFKCQGCARRVMIRGDEFVAV